MVGRLSVPRAALVGCMIVTVGACTTPKPKVDQKAEEAAERARANRATQEAIHKETAPLGSQQRPTRGTRQLRAGETLWMQSGKSVVVHVPYAVTRVSIGNPDLAGVVVLSPHSILVNAKEVPRNDEHAAGGGLRQQAGLLSSHTFTPPPRLAETTVILWDSKNETDSHDLFVGDFLAEQVLLEVTIAELNRTKMEQRGVDFQTLGGSTRFGYWLGGGQTPASTQFLPVGGTGGTPAALPPVFPLIQGPESPTFAFQSANGDVTALVTMLQTEGLATVLAQPKIMALSGQNAVFQVGGEIPIRIVTSFSVEVEFKAFGTLVNFVPRISQDGDILLTVTPEVSQPDFANQVEGVPTFRTRRASTSVKMREGETLVLGGLTQHTRIEQERGLPYLKDIPYAGQLFRNTTYTDEVNELMVVVTPHLARSIQDGDYLDLPSDRGPLTRDDVKTKPEPGTVTQPRLPTPRYNSQMPAH